jgi:hypothetical protein
MTSLRLDRLPDLFHSATFFLVMLWVGLAALGIGVAVLLYTRWGRAHPLGKSMALSILAHALVAGFSTTLYVAPQLDLFQGEIIHVTIAEKETDSRQPGPGGPGSEGGGGKGDALSRHFKARPWEALGPPPRPRLLPADLPPLEDRDRMAPQRQGHAGTARLTGTPALSPFPLSEAAQPQPGRLVPAKSVVTQAKPAESRPAEPIQAPVAQRRQGERAVPPGLGPVERLAEPAQPAAEPVRQNQAALAAKIMEQSLELPRVEEAPAPSPLPDRAIPVTVGPGEAGLRGKPVQPHRPAAAGSVSANGAQDAGDRPEQTGSDPGSAEAGAGGAGATASSGGGLPAAADTGHLKPPALAGSTTGIGTGGGLAGDGAADSSGVGPPQLPGRRGGLGDQSLPEVYRLRTSPDRARLAERHGATRDTEAAVQAALKWLAAAQSADGRWAPRQFGAGREAKIAGHERYGAGSTADTGLTGLAALAFLAAGNTPLDGTYQATTRRALEFLVRSQGADGSLGGEAAIYESMYCHGMATIALTEAYGMTKDARLRDPVRRAVLYTLGAQDPQGGGWRYRSQESGDTSQLGWQLMALKSAELAGIPVPDDAWKGVGRFLKSVSSGSGGGLASYRPAENVSRTMTAEALVCRQFLGMPAESPTAQEAGNYLLAALPGAERSDFYYWYYATLGMYQLGGLHWQRWNDALRATLPASQVQSGAFAGSWDPDNVWGNYGGRIYSTALGTLCLEVYYRFLPLTTAGAPAAAATREAETSR